MARLRRAGPAMRLAGRGRPATTLAAALALLAAAARAPGAAGLMAPPPVLTPGGEAAETLTFFVTSDWGGQEVAPYTTPLQTAMAEAMGRVSASFHPKFIVSAGGNFLPAGMPGVGTARRVELKTACGPQHPRLSARAARRQARARATPTT
jgi:hypothetical protein